MRIRRMIAMIAAALCFATALPSHATGVMLVLTRGSKFIPGDVSLPLALYVPQGSTLYYQNLDLVAHSVVSIAKDGNGVPIFNSGDPVYANHGPDEVVGVSALQAGSSFPFRCAIHPEMQGTLVIV